MAKSNLLKWPCTWRSFPADSPTFRLHNLRKSNSLKGFGGESQYSKRMLNAATSTLQTRHKLLLAHDQVAHDQVAHDQVDHQ